MPNPTRSNRHPSSYIVSASAVSRPAWTHSSMDRKLARKNIRSGLIAGAAALIMFGVTFLAAAIYVHP